MYNWLSCEIIKHPGIKIITQSSVLDVVRIFLEGGDCSSTYSVTSVMVNMADKDRCLGFFSKNKIGVLDQMDPIFQLVLVLMSVEAINESTDDPIFWLAAHSFLIQYILIHHHIKYIIHVSIYSVENAETKD